ncbi:glycosyltransferase family 4 protein [Microbacterium sp.]|uniref:glycosyltransferase family 4 protein n=1 Tax=Microbacterium sp. TaxID=51671 RepID=UPI003242104D
MTPAVFGPGRRGGGERYVSELVAAERDAGVAVQTLVVPSMWSAHLIDENTNVRRDGRSLFRAVRQADVIHVHQLNTPGFDYAAFIAMVAGKPLVLTDHGGGLLAPGRALGRLRLHFVTAAAFVSEWSRSDLDPTGVIASYRIVYGGGDHILSRPVASSKTDFPRSDYGFVGRLLPHKGAHIAITALPSDKSLHIIGEARDAAYLDELRNLAEGKQVTFTHDLRDDDLLSAYQSFGALLVPSVSDYKGTKYDRPELLGLSALEALCARTPVVASAVGGLGEAMSWAGQTVLTPGDTDAWSVELGRGDEERHVLGGPAAPTWAGVAQRCTELYEAALSKKNR